MREFSSWMPATLFAAALMVRGASADVIVTADGETISGHEVSVVDGVFQTPGENGAAPRTWTLDSLQRVRISASRPTSELKTRFVRIELPGNPAFLHLAEVQVFEGDENIALKGKATQSSLYEDRNEESWGAQKAIDGNTDGNSGNLSTTHTKAEVNPWWEVDLTRDATVKKIAVWNRTDDNVASRLAGFRIVLLNEKRDPLWTHTFPEAPNPNVEIEPPLRGDAFSEGDIKAFDSYSGNTAAGGVLNSLVNWLSGKKPETPQPSGSAPATSTAASAPAGGGSRMLHRRTAAPTVDAEAEFPDGARRFELVDGGQITGKLQKWTDQGLTIEMTTGGQTITVTVPVAMVQEVLSKETASRQTPIDRAAISPDSDTVFAKTESGALQAVAGKVKGVEGESLLFEYKGKDRKINLSRIMALIVQSRAPAQEQPFAVIHLKGGQRIPGIISSLADGKAAIETLWKEKIELPRTALLEISVRNGRVTSLADMAPTKAEYTPFLDRVLTHTTNESLSGDDLQVGESTFERGLCLHSRTVLTYDLNARYSRLRASLGLQNGDGDQGKALVRVLADGASLYEKQIEGAAVPETLDLDTTGKKTLTLEVDFGDNMNIGDHVVLGEPVLVRPSAP